MILDVMNLSRNSAIVIIDNKLYLDDNHFLALEQSGIEESSSVYFFDVFENAKGEPRFLVAHFQEGLEKCKEKIERYAKLNGLRLGYYIENEISFCKII